MTRDIRPKWVWGRAHGEEQVELVAGAIQVDEHEVMQQLLGHLPTTVKHSLRLLAKPELTWDWRRK